MKVLYFHQHFSLPSGSTGIRSYQMAKRLISSGHEVTMICGSYKGGNTGLVTPFKRGKRQGMVDGINIIEFELSYSNSDGFMKRTITFLKFALKSVFIALTGKYDLVFATSTPLTAGIPGIFARWLRFKPFVFEVRDLWPELPKEMGVIKNPIILWAMSILEWTSYHSANHIIGLSPGIIEGIKKRGIAEKRTSMIPNGCDLSIFSGVQSKWRPVSIAENDFLAIYTGTHGQANGLDAVLDAAKEIIKLKHDHIKVLLVGQGRLKNHLQKRVKVEKITNVFFHDPVNKKELAELMAGADLGLQILENIPAFYYGTSPNKFFDYISASLPVLTNYPGWIADLLTENESGFSIPPDDPVRFAEVIIHCSNNKQKLSIMGSNALKLAIREFDRDNLSQKFVKVLELMITK